MKRNQRINFALRESKVGQTGLAAALRVAQSSISRRLSSETEVSDLDLIRLVSELTGFSFVWLVDGDGPEKLTQENGLVISRIKSASSIFRIRHESLTTAVNHYLNDPNFYLNLVNSLGELGDDKLTSEEEMAKVKLPYQSLAKSALVKEIQALALRIEGIVEKLI